MRCAALSAHLAFFAARYFSYVCIHVVCMFRFLRSSETATFSSERTSRKTFFGRRVAFIFYRRRRHGDLEAGPLSLTHSLYTYTNYAVGWRMAVHRKR